MTKFEKAALDTIKSFITLKREIVKLEESIESSKKNFYSSCDAYSNGKDSFEIDGATISKTVTPGKWKYSKEIVEMEELLKAKKKSFQLLNECIGGRSSIWKIELK